MDRINNRMQDEVHKMISDLDKECMRKLQGDMHRCSANCCDDGKLSMENVQTCIEHCTQPAMQIQELLQNELQRMQDRMQRCAGDCQDRIRDKTTIGSSPSTSVVMERQKEFENCVVNCAEDIIKNLPNIAKRIRETAKQYQKK